MKIKLQGCNLLYTVTHNQDDYFADQSLQLKGYNPTVSDPFMYLKEYILEGDHHIICR